jgi:hypothetical protein
MGYFGPIEPGRLLEVEGSAGRAAKSGMKMESTKKSRAHWPWWWWVIMILFPIPFRPWWLGIFCFVVFVFLIFLLNPNSK